MTYSKIEEVRQYWNNRPCNIKHSDKPVGSAEYFDEVSLRKYLVEPHIIDFARFSEWKDKEVLEIGCGIGTDTMNFALAGAHVTAVDISEMSIYYAKMRARLYGVEDNIDFYCGNVEELGTFLPRKKFDLIYSFGVLHHTPNPDKAMWEISKFSRVGTVLKIMLYNRYSWKVLTMLLKYGSITKQCEAQQDCPVAYTYSKEAARDLLHDFHVKSIEVDHIFPYDIEEYKQYRYKKVWYFRWMPDRMFRWMERRFGWHLLITAVV